MSLGPTREEQERQLRIWASLPPILQLIVGRPGGGEVNPQAPGALSSDGAAMPPDLSVGDTTRTGGVVTDQNTFTDGKGPDTTPTDVRLKSIPTTSIAAPPPTQRHGISEIPRTSGGTGFGHTVMSDEEVHAPAMAASPNAPAPPGAALGTAGLKPSKDTLAAMPENERKNYYQSYGRTGWDLNESELSGTDARNYRLGKRTDEDGNFKKEGGKYSAVKNFLKGLGIGMLEGGAQGGLIGAITGGVVGGIGNTVKGGAGANAWGWKNFHEPRYQKQIAEERGAEDRRRAQELQDQNLRGGELINKQREQGIGTGELQQEAIREGLKSTRQARELAAKQAQIPRVQTINGIDYYVDPNTGDMKIAGQTTEVTVNGEKVRVPVEWAFKNEQEREKRRYEAKMKAAEFTMQQTLEILKAKMNLASEREKHEMQMAMKEYDAAVAAQNQHAQQEAEERLKILAWELDNKVPDEK